MEKEFNLSEKIEGDLKVHQVYIKEFIKILRHEGQIKCWGYFDDVIDKLAGDKFA